MSSGARNQDFTDLSEIEGQLSTLNSLIPVHYTNGVLTYDGNNNLSTVVFYENLIAVATITLTYDGSGNLSTFATT